MSLPDQLQPLSPVPCPWSWWHVMYLGQDLPVHLQTMEIALLSEALSQKLVERTHCLAQCISHCGEKCLAPLFLTAM